MKSSKFKRLKWLVVIFMAAVIIAAIGGFAAKRWFEIVAAIYLAAGTVIMFLPQNKW